MRSEPLYEVRFPLWTEIAGRLCFTCQLARIVQLMDQERFGINMHSVCYAAQP